MICFNEFYTFGNGIFSISGSKIDMTAPVVTTITPGANADHETVMEMHFMIPHDLQPFPPTPTEPHVYITYLPPMDLYVK